MRLRNLLFVLLLCMTVGVLGTSCTGDDGAQGPPGPPGPPGPAGEPMDGDMEETTAFYDFLKSWGSETGEIACSDPLLTGMGPLPGPEELEAIIQRADDTSTNEVNEAILNSAVRVTCDNGDWGAVNKVGAQPVTSTEGIVLWKTDRMKMTHEGDPVRVPKDDFGLAKEIETTTYFVGGSIAANIPSKGGDEGFERAALNNQCGIGTSPPAIIGKWRAVKKEAKITTYEDGKKVEGTVSAPNPIPKAPLLLKVCVVLDAHPGVTKCYVNKLKNDGTHAMSVNLYDGENLVMPPVVTMDKLPGNSDTDQHADLFSGVGGGGGAADATSDFGDVENLCALFSQGVKP